MLRHLEEWRETLDENYVVGGVLMDLSKAFDCVKYFTGLIFSCNISLGLICIFIIIIIIVLRKLMGKPGGFWAQDAILCQNGRMSHEKQWNDLHIYVKSGVIVYPQPCIHNSVGWASSRVGA